jgi:glycosyltransferase involved in cell wall biosynthesis
MQKILFVHNNFPAQFLQLSQALAACGTVQMAAIGSPTARALPGVKLVKYAVAGEELSLVHPFARRFEAECRRAEQVLYAASNLAATGFVPDIVIGHPGWGETLPLRSVFPKARIITYCEFFYRSQGQDVGFDPEFPEMGIDGNVRIHLKNAATLLALEEADAGLSPTVWQRSTYPKEFQPKIKVIHDGVDTDLVAPLDGATLTLRSGRTLTQDDEVVTFATRNHEPLRGFHSFIRAIPRILAKRPRAQILIVGGSGSGYGYSPPDGQTWRSVFMKEIADQVDQSRIHFTDDLNRTDYLRALQISSAHIYFTYPFVLSWSILEAMSAGCLLIASDTAPVQEVINGKNGILVPFFNVDQLAGRIIEALAHPGRFTAKRRAARATVVDNYDLKRVCLPQLMDFLAIEPEKGASVVPKRTRARRQT